MGDTLRKLLSQCADRLNAFRKAVGVSLLAVDHLPRSAVKTVAPPL